jgi:3-isopropylmalate dehydrogenase
MMLRYSLDESGMAQRIEQAVNRVLDEGLRTPDILAEGMTEVNCEAMGDAIVDALD